MKSLNLQSWLEKKTVHPENISSWREEIRKKGLTLASLNGSFDLMHSGHLHILYEASLQADILIIGLNTDSSIQQYKSANRPIIKLSDRLAMMASLAMVDFVSYFDETTPNDWLKRIQPDVHVNGAEYGQDCVEAPTLREMGSRLHLVDRVPGLATSSIIERIRAL